MAMPQLPPSYWELEQFKEYLLKRLPVFPPSVPSHQEVWRRNDSHFETWRFEQGGSNGTGPSRMVIRCHHKEGMEMVLCHIFTDILNLFKGGVRAVFHHLDCIVGDPVAFDIGFN
jgi:hypothetical protein